MTMTAATKPLAAAVQTEMDAYIKSVSSQLHDLNKAASLKARQNYTDIGPSNSSP